MIKDDLASKEAIAYRCLKNDLNNDTVANSYLFYGEYSPLKVETAYLLAMSIIENKKDFACETCPTCQRIHRNAYLDVAYIDGYARSIKVDDIEKLMANFSLTGVENKGRKVYIIANINNASIAVFNKLLKFMEEPANENTYGIFVSDNREDLLDTIISRCRCIPFNAKDYSCIEQLYIGSGFSKEDAHLLSAIKHEFKGDFSLDDQNFHKAKTYVYQTIDNLNQKEYLPILFSADIFTETRDDLKIIQDYYFSIMIKMIKDALLGTNVDDNYDQYLAILAQNNPNKLLEIFIQESDNSLYGVDRKLLFDDIAFQIISLT